MAKDLTESLPDRQNILNNRYALKQAEQHLALVGFRFLGGNHVWWEYALNSHTSLLG